MTQYRFRLATLSKLRVQERDQRRIEHGQALEAERILSARQEALIAELEAMQNLLRAEANAGVVDVDKLQGIQRYRLLLQAQLAALRQQKEQVALEVERRRLALVDADRQVKTLEKLRDRQLSLHERALEEVERKEFDEAALAGFIRLQREEAAP